MKRAIVTPADLAGMALDELKQWLAITTSRDDAALTALLHAATDTCEGFTRQMPITTLCEEMVPAMRGWHCLATAPVQAITAISAIASDGTMRPLDPGTYLFDIDGDGHGRINLLTSIAESRISVRFTAGLANDWNSLPQGLRHGMIRLAAHYYRDRNDGGERAPPAAVAALWQPWRRMRLA